MAGFTQIKRALKLKMQYKETFVMMRVFNTAIVDGVTTTSDPDGSIAFDTTVPSLFIADGGLWVALATQSATPSFTTLEVTGAADLQGAVTAGSTLGVTGLITATAGVVGPAVGEVVTTTNPLTAAESGKVFFLNAAGGFTTTLPAVALGLNFKFIVFAAPTGADYIIASATADNIIGYPVASAGSDETANGNAAGDVINFKANVALPGDSVEVFSDGVSWHVRALVKATGAVTITG